MGNGPDYHKVSINDFIGGNVHSYSLQTWKIY